jgi:DNA-binding transcriptional ArsR family regulator
MTRLLAVSNPWGRLRGNSRLSVTAGIPTRFPVGAFIVYRRLTMNDQARPLARDTAAQYASWFRALADPTRVQILSLLARGGGPLTVGAITGAVDVGQSTVSAHLKVLAEVGFVLAERRGTSVRYRVNDRCVDRFPTAADVVMGKAAPAVGWAAGKESA